MKKKIIILCCIIFPAVIFGLSAAFSAEKAVDTDKILAIDPSTLTKGKFYECEEAIIAKFTQSGVPLLGDREIQWLLKAEEVLKSKGVKLKYEDGLHYVIAWSYFNHHEYEKALPEFRKIKNQNAIELSEWFVNNKGGGTIIITEYPGKPPSLSTETSRAGPFVSFMKGPVYKYDEKTDQHAIICAFEDKNDWCDRLTFDNRMLNIRLREGEGMFVFDNISNMLRKIK